MKVYCVLNNNSNLDGITVVSIFHNLEHANEYARRCMNDSWRVQDGYPYETIHRPDGTSCYLLEFNEGEISYYVEEHKVKEKL